MIDIVEVCTTCIPLGDTQFFVQYCSPTYILDLHWICSLIVFFNKRGNFEGWKGQWLNWEGMEGGGGRLVFNLKGTL